jgi:hypothetical protein
MVYANVNIFLMKAFNAFIAGGLRNGVENFPMMMANNVEHIGCK